MLGRALGMADGQLQVGQVVLRDDERRHRRIGITPALEQHLSQGERLQDELYEFKDATGTIHVEIDDEDWPPQAISEKATVKLTGEVDKDLTSREIDVDIVELVK